MNLVLCCEGARLDSGGFGLVAVPQIARALAELGHSLVLENFGPPTPGVESFLTTDANQAWREPLVAYAYPARGRYAFSQLGWQRTMEHAVDADFLMLHSLYSFAVVCGYFAARRSGKKYGLWPHGVLAPFQRRVGARKKTVYDALIGRRILDRSSVIFYNAVGERNEAAALHLAPPSVIIPHGIELAPFRQLPSRGAFRAKFFPGFQGPLGLYLGRLNAKKGLDVLVQAMAYVRRSVPEARLAIVGAGDPPAFADQVKAWIREQGLENEIVMCGALMGPEKFQALTDADLFVLPSAAENFSFAMFEAMAARLPVVVSDSLNFAPEVKQYGAGRIVPREPMALAQAMIELFDAPAVRRGMGEGGARLAAQYSWQAVGKQMERAIYAVVNGNPLPHDLIFGTAT